MRRRFYRPSRSGLDPVGPVHPYLAYAGVMLLNFLGLLLLVGLLVGLVDWVENLF